MKKLKTILFFIILSSYVYGKTDSVVFLKLDSIKHILDSMGAREPEYVMAQAIYESHWFNCKDCSLKYNNIFGFKVKSGKYMRFNSFSECVIYYVKWQDIRYSKYKLKYPHGTYLSFLKWCKYALSDDYNKQIQWVHDWILKNYSIDR